MTVWELKDLIKDYPDDQSVHLRVWLNPNKDYLDEGIVQTAVVKIQQGVSGALLITGDATRME